MTTPLACCLRIMAFFRRLFRRYTPGERDAPAPLPFRDRYVLSRVSSQRDTLARELDVMQAELKYLLDQGEHRVRNRFH